MRLCARRNRNDPTFISIFRYSQGVTVNIFKRLKDSFTKHSSVSIYVFILLRRRWARLKVLFTDGLFMRMGRVELFLFKWPRDGEMKKAKCFVFAIWHHQTCKKQLMFAQWIRNETKKLTVKSKVKSVLILGFCSNWLQIMICSVFLRFSKPPCWLGIWYYIRHIRT